MPTVRLTWWMNDAISIRRGVIDSDLTTGKLYARPIYLPIRLFLWF
jgi:hypothetical protein